MSDLIDISLPLSADLPAWPGSSSFCLKRVKQLESGAQANVSRLKCEVHFGTHIDAPSHFINGAATVDEISLKTLIGPAVVAYLPDCPAVCAKNLESLDLALGTERLLLRTANSLLWARKCKTFHREYVALTEDAARWIVARGIRLIGIDYLSVQRFNDGPEVHQILLQNGVVLLEGLNLDSVVPGDYELLALPLNLAGAEGAPVRAVLRSLPINLQHCTSEKPYGP